MPPYTPAAPGGGIGNLIFTAKSFLPGAPPNIRTPSPTTAPFKKDI